MAVAYLQGGTLNKTFQGFAKSNWKRFKTFVMVAVLLWSLAFLTGFNNYQNSPYVGIWKLEKIVIWMEKVKVDNVTTLHIFPNGKFTIWIDMVSITGTYAILRNGHLEIREEAIEGKRIEPPTVSEWVIEGEKLIKALGDKKSIFRRLE
jgi:hypothetical protein